MRKIVSKMQAATVDGDLVIVLDGDPELTVGEAVEVLVGKKSLGNWKFAAVDKIRLMDITTTDLIGFVYAMPQIFWQRFESATATGLPGEHPVYFITFSPVWEEVEEFVALEEDDEVPVIKAFDDGEKPAKPYNKKKNKKRFEEKPHTDWSDLDE